MSNIPLITKTPSQLVGAINDLIIQINALFDAGGDTETVLGAILSSAVNQFTFRGSNFVTFDDSTGRLELVPLPTLMPPGPADRLILVPFMSPDGFYRMTASDADRPILVAWQPTGLTSAGTASGNILHFNQTPNAAIVGATVANLTAPSTISPGTTVLSFDTTSVTLSANVASAVSAGQLFQFGVASPVVNISNIAENRPYVVALANSIVQFDPGPKGIFLDFPGAGLGQMLQVDGSDSVTIMRLTPLAFSVVGTYQAPVFVNFGGLRYWPNPDGKWQLEAQTTVNATSVAGVNLPATFSLDTGFHAMVSVQKADTADIGAVYVGTVTAGHFTIVNAGSGQVTVNYLVNNMTKNP